MFQMKNNYFTLILYIFLNFEHIFSYSNDDCRLILINENSTNVDGSVDIYYNNHWYPLCGAVWDFEDAEVTCRAAGYTNGALNFYTIPNSTSDVYYLRYSGFHCRGNESKLKDCPHEVKPIFINDTKQCNGFAVAVCVQNVIYDVKNEINYAVIFGSISGCLLVILLSIGGYRGYKYIKKLRETNEMTANLL